MHHLIRQYSKDFSSCKAHDSSATALFADVHSCICNVVIIRASEKERQWVKAEKSNKSEDGSTAAFQRGGTALNNKDKAVFMLFGGTRIHSRLALIRLMVLWHTKRAHFTLDSIRIKTNTYFRSRQRKAVARVVSVGLYGAMRC